MPNWFCAHERVIWVFSHEGDKYQNNTRPRVSLARFTWSTFCGWRHSRLWMTSQWSDNCEAITWIMVSNLLDIAFIHGNNKKRWLFETNIFLHIHYPLFEQHMNNTCDSMEFSGTKATKPQIPWHSMEFQIQSSTEFHGHFPYSRVPWISNELLIFTITNSIEFPGIQLNFFWSSVNSVELD